jgi:mannose-6-phosphate isomerase-like protein (cupin superfamily)
MLCGVAAGYGVRLALARLVAPDTGAQHQSQFYLTLPAGSSPVLASDEGDVVLWVRSGAGAVEIEGRSFPIDGPCGVYIRRGEGFRLTASAPLAVYVSECPGGNALNERAEMGADFDESYPDRLAQIDEEARRAMGPRYFQVLLDDRHGLRNTAQFIGHIPAQGRDAPPPLRGSADHHFGHRGHLER